MDTRTELEKRADIEAEESRMKPEVLDPWQPMETAPKDQRIWAWGDNWHWQKGKIAYAHSDYNSHKNVVCRDGLAGATFRIGDKDAPTHWMPLPTPPAYGD